MGQGVEVRGRRSEVSAAAGLKSGQDKEAWSKEKRSEVNVQPGAVGWVERLFDRRVSPFH